MVPSQTARVADDATGSARSRAADQRTKAELERDALLLAAAREWQEASGLSADEAAESREAARPLAESRHAEVGRDPRQTRRVTARGARQIRHRAWSELDEARAVTEKSAVAAFATARDAQVTGLRWPDFSPSQPSRVAPLTPPPPAERLQPPETRPALVPVLAFGDELALRLLVLAGLGGMAWFWSWWLGPGHGHWDGPTLVVTALFVWIFFLPVYFFFFVCRMTRPNTEIPVPDVRVAMVVTKAPSEPWPVLQRTLLAMLNQEYPHAYDVWLADELPTPQSRKWCADHTVMVCTRAGVPAYQRPTWPRRSRSKEGNLAYFYDTVGYARYDVVAQLDADHIPTPGYLAAMVRPFADPAVGYVAAPSICDANLADGWTVKGRLYREASMHGPVQAGSNAGFAPVCIGSHYAVRTAALRQVGGIGPELAEDYSTSLWLLSGGWQGVFSPDAEAHGDGPASVEEMLVQELQWSRSLGSILVKWAPPRLLTVPWRARIRMGFALLFYPVQGLVLALAAALPVIGLVFGFTWGRTSVLGFYLHLWPTSVIGLAVAAFLRSRRVLRPPDAKLWSWELLLFQMLRWPWTLIGFFQGMYAGLRSKVTTFRVTPKSETGPKPLATMFLLPTLFLGSVPALAIAASPHPDRTAGPLALCVIQALSYLGCAITVTALQLLSNRRRQVAPIGPTPRGASPLAGSGIEPGPWGDGWAVAAVCWSTSLVVLAALAWRLALVL